MRLDRGWRERLSAAGARHLRLGVFAQPYYFLLTNIDSMIAMLRYLGGDRMVIWTLLRE